MSEAQLERAMAHPDPMRPHDQARRNAIQVEIGRRLRGCRQRQGLSMRDIAERVGISIQQVGKYENGQSSPYISMLYGFSQALGVTVPDLLEGIAQPEPEPGLWPATMLRVGDRDAMERMALIDMFDRIPDAVLRRMLLKMVVHMADNGTPGRPATIEATLS